MKILFKVEPDRVVQYQIRLVRKLGDDALSILESSLMRFRHVTKLPLIAGLAPTFVTKIEE